MMWLLNVYFLALYALALNMHETTGMIVLAALYGYLSTELEHIRCGS
jgi:hypothetical protein